MNSQIHDENQAPEQAVDTPTEVETDAVEETAQKTANASQEQETVVTQAKFDTVQAQAQEYLEGWQRARAEFANYKKRIEREMKDNQSTAAGNVVKDILPVIDDFERALSNLPEDLRENAWVGGMSMIQRKLLKVLEDYNVTIVDPTGEPFDPNIHEAIAMDDSDEVASGHVIATMQKGYVLGERVLRPALVRVAK